MRLGLVQRRKGVIEVNDALVHEFARQTLTPEPENAVILTKRIEAAVDALDAVPIQMVNWLPHFQAVAIFEKVLGSEHPHTRIVRGNLAALNELQSSINCMSC